MVIPNIVVPFMKLCNLSRRKSKSQRGSRPNPKKCHSCNLHRCPTPYPEVPQKCLHKCSPTKEQQKTSRSTSSASSRSQGTETSFDGITLCEQERGGKNKYRDGRRDGAMDWKMLPKYQYDAMKDEIQKLQKEISKKTDEIKKLNEVVNQSIVNIMDELESSGL